MHSLRQSAVLSVAVLVTALASHLARAQGGGDVGLVERVIDGDTVAVEGMGPVRLIGVDTPETVHPTKAVEAFGHEATQFLKSLVLGQLVHLEYDVPRKDCYGRTLAYLRLKDGTFVNAEIVRQGYGHALTRYPFRYLEEFRRLERDAREQKRGLWREP